MGSDYVIVFNGPVDVARRAAPLVRASERPAESAFAARAALAPVAVGGRAIPPMLAAALARAGVMSAAPPPAPVPAAPLAPEPPAQAQAARRAEEDESYWKLGAFAAAALAVFGAAAYAYYRSDAPTLEFVHMPGCGACRTMGDLLDYTGGELARAGVHVRRSDIKTAPAEWHVDSTPALIMRRGGRVVGAVKGRRAEALLDAGKKAPEKLLRWARAKVGG